MASKLQTKKKFSIYINVFYSFAILCFIYVHLLNRLHDKSRLSISYEQFNALVKTAKFIGIAFFVLATLFLIIHKFMKVAPKSDAKVDAKSAEKEKQTATKTEKPTKKEKETKSEKTEKVTEKQAPRDNSPWGRKLTYIRNSSKNRRKFVFGGKSDFPSEQKESLKKFTHSGLLEGRMYCPLCNKEMIKVTVESMFPCYFMKDVLKTHEFERYSNVIVKDVYEKQETLCGYAIMKKCSCSSCGIIASGLDNIPKNAEIIYAKNHEALNQTNSDIVKFNDGKLKISKELMFKYNLFGYNENQIRCLKNYLCLERWDTSLKKIRF